MSDPNSEYNFKYIKRYIYNKLYFYNIYNNYYI